MTLDELLGTLARDAHALAWEQRREFTAETERLEAERADRERRRREQQASKPKAKGT